MLGLALGLSAALVSAPARAAVPTSTPGLSSSAVCLHPGSRPTKWREPADTTDVSTRVKREVSSVVASADRTAALGSRLAYSGDQARTTSRRVVVRVFIHVIHGRKKNERRIHKHAARKMFRILKAGYAGAQDPAVAGTSIRFRLKRITFHRNVRWYHAAPYSSADRQMKRKLHRGTAETLNIYVNRPRSQGQLLLGFSTFPWQRAWRKKLDAVTVSDISLPGGRARGYNLGDTVIHETGHWLGLLHTFEGSPDGCTGPGDGVADTPAEAEASFRCDDRNTCVGPEFVDPATGLRTIDPNDPIHNFMDYSFDFCMNQFTAGQNNRMVALFRHFRSGR